MLCPSEPVFRGFFLPASRSAYIPLADDSARQTIDAMALRQECARVRRQYQDYTAGMYCKVEGEYEYLVKTKACRRQERIGRRTPEAERSTANSTNTRALFNRDCNRSRLNWPHTHDVAVRKCDLSAGDLHW